MSDAPSIHWDGLGARGVLAAASERERDDLADAARRYDWATVLAMVRRSPGLANAIRPGGSAAFAPLHQAAYGGAPAAVAEELVRLGAWRSLRDSEGRRPLEIAQDRGHAHLIAALTPRPDRSVWPEVLAAVERNFHAVIRGRVSDLIARAALRLPQLEPMLETGVANWWFPVPGFYGGFSYRLHGADGDVLLVSESWSRVVGGSGERHEIDAGGSRLVASGFV